MFDFFLASKVLGGKGLSVLHTYPNHTAKVVQIEL